MPARLVEPFSFRLSFGLKGSAAQSAAWKGEVETKGLSSAGRGEVETGAEDGGRGRGRFAARRVEGEGGAIGVGADVAQVDRDALDDVGDRVRAGGVEEDFAGFGVDVEGEADDNGADVEGTDDAGGDRDQGDGATVVGAGEVDLAGGVGQRGADAGAGEGAADLGGGGAARAVELFLAAVGAGARRGGGDRRVRAEGDAGQLAGHARRQLDREVGDLLFGVGPGQSGR